MMNGRYGRWRAAFALASLVVVGLVAVIAYNAGVARGVSQQVGMAYPYAGPHFWGFGFFFPLLFAFLALRLLFWGAFWRRRGYGGYGGYGRCGGYGGYGYGVPPAFDEWHRRAHGGGGPGPDPRATSV
jgi:hypothetical protein